MERDALIAYADTSVHASPKEVWDALTNPAVISQYMMGATVESAWKTGSRIVWKGEWKGKKFEDHGEVLDALPGKYLKYTHNTGDSVTQNLEQQHTVTVKLDAAGDETRISLTQDNNPDEKQKKESEKNWEMMLGKLKEIVEENHAF